MKKCVLSFSFFLFSKIFVVKLALSFWVSLISEKQFLAVFVVVVFHPKFTIASNFSTVFYFHYVFIFFRSIISKATADTIVLFSIDILFFIWRSIRAFACCLSLIYPSLCHLFQYKRIHSIVQSYAFVEVYVLQQWFPNFLRLRSARFQSIKLN